MKLHVWKVCFDKNKIKRVPMKRKNWNEVVMLEEMGVSVEVALTYWLTPVMNGKVVDYSDEVKLCATSVALIFLPFQLFWLKLGSQTLPKSPLIH